MRRKRRLAVALALIVVLAVAASAAVVKARDTSTAASDRLALQKRFAEIAGVKGAVPWGTNGLSISGGCQR